MRITISIPCYGRPQRTRRIIDNVLAQTIDGWEALIIGDCCPVIQEIIDRGEYAEEQIRAEKKGNRLIIENLDRNYGGCGYEITNRNIQRAAGKYFVFAANDDVLLPRHFENYLGEIENTDYDFVYFNSLVAPVNIKRISWIGYGSIGHSELIVKTSFAKQMPPHNAEYGHDYVFITDMVWAGGKYAKARTAECTYIVKSLPNKQEQGID